MYISRATLLLLFAGYVVCASTFVLANDTLQDQRIEFYTAKAGGEFAGDALDEAAVALLKEELHYVQLQLERYSVDYTPQDEMEVRVYPYSINELCAQIWSGYRRNLVSYLMPGLYPNPLRSNEATERNAQCVPFGWDDTLSPGNFSYLTRYDQESGKVDGYLILGYGPTRDSGMDVDSDGTPDGVIIMLGSHDIDWTQPLTLFDNGRLVTVKVE